MSLVLNMVGGGVGGDTYAFIVVSYPAGSTCTCAKGGKTLTAKDTSGTWAFQIPEAGAWTVSCTDGTNTASETVTISSEGESASVRLTYIPDGAVYWLGDECASKTGGWGTYGRENGGYEITKNATNVYMWTYFLGGSHYGDAALYTENSVDLSQYTTLKCALINCVCSTTFSGTSEVGLYVTSTKEIQSTTPPKSTLAKSALVGSAIVMDGNYEFSVSISAVSAGFISLQMHPRTDGQISWDAVKIWME